MVLFPFQEIGGMVQLRPLRGGGSDAVSAQETSQSSAVFYDAQSSNARSSGFDRQRLIKRVLTGLAPYVPEGTLKVEESGIIVGGTDNVALAVQVEEEPPVVRVLGTVVSAVPFSEDLCA